MRANPGGQIDPSNLIGRDSLISKLWRTLERQSLRLTSVRRMGKTSIIKKMKQEVINLKTTERVAFYNDLEDIHTPFEFAEAVYRDIAGSLTRWQRTSFRARRLSVHLAGLEVAGIIKLPNALAPYWKELLEKSIGSLVSDNSCQAIFFWDEVPSMLQNIKQRTGEKDAMEILDTLRALRQEHRNLRMVFTGSIGFHNVLSSFRGAGYANTPLNDMYCLEVPPLSFDDAQKLARLLIRGERIKTDDPSAVVEAIAKEVDSIPFYIHHVIERLIEQETTVNTRTINRIVNDILMNEVDPWDLNHYSKRILIYYLPDEQPIAYALLDILSNAENPLSFDDLFNLVKSKLPIDNSKAVRDVLGLLQQDHYIAKDATGYCFRFSLVKRWWQLQK